MNYNPVNSMPDGSLRTPDVSPKSSKVGAFLPRPPPFGEKSPFPGIKKAGRGRTLSGQMTPSLHFSPSEGALLPIQPHILTFYQSKHAKRTTQASYQNLGGYMCLHQYFDTDYDCWLNRFRVFSNGSRVPFPRIFAHVHSLPDDQQRLYNGLLNGSTAPSLQTARDGQALSESLINGAAYTSV